MSLKRNLERILERLPSKIRITKDISYEILYIDAFPDPTQLAEMRPMEKQIVLKKGQSTTEITKSLIHEICHAVSDENDIKLTETQVGKLEEAIFRVFRLNNIFDFANKL